MAAWVRCTGRTIRGSNVPFTATLPTPTDGQVTSIAIAPDGRQMVFSMYGPDGRFLMLKPEGPRASVLVITLNWLNDLKARLAAGATGGPK